MSPAGTGQCQPCCGSKNWEPAEVTPSPPPGSLGLARLRGWCGGRSLLEPLFSRGCLLLWTLLLRLPKRADSGDHTKQCTSRLQTPWQARGLFFFPTFTVSQQLRNLHREESTLHPESHTFSELVECEVKFSGPLSALVLIRAASGAGGRPESAGKAAARTRVRGRDWLRARRLGRGWSR